MPDTPRKHRRWVSESVLRYERLGNTEEESLALVARDMGLKWPAMHWTIQQLGDLTFLRWIHQEGKLRP